jgi:PAS domain S-box-containing protein
MSPLFWIDIAALSASTVLAVSLVLMVLGADPRRARNRAFAAFTLTEALWAGTSLALRLALWIERGNPLFLSELMSLAFALMGPLLLWFTARYLGRPTAKTDLVAGGGLATIIAISIPLFSHRVVSDPHLDTNGSTVLSLNYLGLIAAAVSIACILWSLALFWVERRRVDEPYLALSVLVLAVGFVVGGVLNVPFPVLSISNTLSVAVLGYGAVSQQLFNPLRERTSELSRANRELQAEIAERMRVEQALRDSRAQAQRLLDRQVTVNKLALALGQTGDLEGICRILYEHIRDLMETDGFIVSFYDPRAQLIHAGYAVTAGVARDVASLPPIPLEAEGCGTQSRVIHTGQPLYVPDWRQAMERTRTEFKIDEEDGSVTRGAPPPEAQADSTNSAVLVPMQIEGQIIGIMQAQSRRLDAYTQQDVDLFSALANVAAVAVHRVRAESQRDASRSQRDAAQSALQEREELYRILGETSPDAITLSDLEGHILAANRQFATMHGFESLDEMRAGGLTDLDLIADPDRHRVVRIAKHAFAAGATYNAEYTAFRRDGTTFPVGISCAPVVDADGNPTRYIAVRRDITERKRLEAQLFQAQKMEAIGRLAGGVAHDFNNLLTVMGGYADLALRYLSADAPVDHAAKQEVRTDLEGIRQVVHQAAALTNQLLIFSRKHTPVPRVLDLNHVVHNIESMLQRLIGEDVELCTVLEPQLGRVKADPGHLEQVIMNLAVNARDAMPQGGKLTLGTGSVELDRDYAQRHLGVQPGHYVMLAVSDTGTGMTEEVKAHLFEPFFTTKEEGKGTGLGLAMVYGIVDQSGGHVEVYSELGVGTTFKVYLPRAEEVAEQVGQDQQPQALLGGAETILLVEDDEMVRELARRSLEQQGYTVLGAEHPDQALLTNVRHDGPIDLLITDVVMPGMGGRELVAWVTKERPEARVLYISGYTEDAIVRHGVLQADTAFLQKPFTPSALAHKVRQVLDA